MIRYILWIIPSMIWATVVKTIGQEKEHSWWFIFKDSLDRVANPKYDLDQLGD